MAWTHPICRACYAKHEPSRNPTKVTGQHEETCCFCNQSTDEGIYYRYDPKRLTCNHE